MSGPAFAGIECGMASWYGLQGQTASGEYIKAGALTAAHPTLPFGTLVRLDNLENGRSVVVRINDRGPFVAGRLIDVTRPVAEKLDFEGSGLARVRMTVVKGKRALPDRGCQTVVASAGGATDPVPLPRESPEFYSTRFDFDFRNAERPVGVTRVAIALGVRLATGRRVAAAEPRPSASFDERFGYAFEDLDRVMRAGM